MAVAPFVDDAVEGEDARVAHPLAPETVPDSVPYDYIPIGCEAAKSLASRATINRLIANGRVRSIHVGPNIYVHAADLRDYINERKNGVRISDVYADLVNRAASFAPAMTPEQRQELVALLSD